MGEIEVRVIPRARREEVAGEREGRLVVRLTAPPVDGAANAALCAARRPARRRARAAREDRAGATATAQGRARRGPHR